MSIDPSGVSAFAGWRVADGSLSGLSADERSLTARFRDWQDQDWTCVFTDVRAFEAIEAIGESLSHTSIATAGPFWDRAWKDAEPGEAAGACFTLWSAWTGRAVLQVVAAGFRIERG